MCTFVLHQLKRQHLIPLNFLFTIATIHVAIMKLYEKKNHIRKEKRKANSTASNDSTVAAAATHTHAMNRT